MGVLRFFKWFFFSVFIIALGLFGVGHYFAVSDMTSWVPLKGGNDGIYLSTVIEQLDTRTLLGNVKEAKEAAPESPEATDVEAAISIDPVVAPSTEGEVAPSEEVVEPAATEPTEEPVVETGYTLDGHSKIEIIIMKLGVSTSPMSWLTEPFNIDKVDVTLSLFVGYAALLLSFILHVITKRHKTVYGTILMIIGFLFIIGFYAASYYPIDGALEYLGISSAESNDFPYLTIFGVTAFSLLGALIGVPIYSCGVRQITCRRLKKRLRRRGISA